MKKFLLTAALVLALITSLTAGTMAYYNVKVDTITADLKTKTFVFTADQKSATFSKTVKMAPGDTAIYEITLNNGSEVSLTSTLVAALVNSQDGITVSVVRKDSTSGNATSVETATDGKTSTATTTMNVSAAGVTSSDKYVITVAWDYGSKLDNTKTASTQGKDFQLKVDINGAQINEAVITSANP